MKFLTLLFFLLPSTFAWWRHTILYEIYLPSFKDTNGDGMGDLNGVTLKLDHFFDLDIRTIYLTPFFKSPMSDMGYDISDYTAINPLFGTMKDFDRLIHEAKKRDIKVIADLVINHSSDEHPWFNKSIDRIDPYTDFYVWADPKGYTHDRKPIPPNNWLSVFDGSIWEWNEKRQQFYLHQFAIKQPDFNLRNEDVKKEIKNIVKFWFDKGINGFRLDGARHFLEDALLRDNPLKNPKQQPPFKGEDFVNYTYSVDSWETYEFIHEIRQYFDDYSRDFGNENERILIAEAYSDLNKTMAYYDRNGYNITNFPFDFDFVAVQNTLPARIFDDKIRRWLDNMPPGATPNWMSENHDKPRVSALNEQYIDIVTITIMTLPGIACIYYGQEIGMQNYRVRKDQVKDHNEDGIRRVGRDAQRLPMQWDDSLNAGFTNNIKPWLPVNPDYWEKNVKAEKANEHSRYNMFKTLSQLRSTNALKHGDFNSYVISEWVYSYVRSCEACDKYVIISNLGTETEVFDLYAAIPDLPHHLYVATASQNAGYETGDRIYTNPKFPHIFRMRPSSAVVLTSRKIAHYNQTNEMEKSEEY